jgi:hypothetical protein
MTTASPPELLALAEHLRDVREPWVAPVSAALDIWLAGESVSLDDAFGLDPAQVRAERRAAAYDERDRLVRLISDRHFRGYPSKAERAGRMAERLAEYHAGPWRQAKAAPRCPHPRGTFDELAWALFEVIDRPISARRIRALLATDF